MAGKSKKKSELKSKTNKNNSSVREESQLQSGNVSNFISSMSSIISELKQRFPRAEVITAFIAASTLWFVWKEVSQLNESIETSTSAGIYNHNGEITSMLLKHPYMLEHFEFIDMPPLDLSSPCDRARLELIDIKRRETLKIMKENKDEEIRMNHTRIQVGCIKYADLFDQTFVLRRTLDDWDYWWTYCCEAYDHHFLIRDYLSKSDSMYSVDNVLKPIEVSDKVDYELTKAFRNEFFKDGDLFYCELKDVETERTKFIKKACK